MGEEIIKTENLSKIFRVGSNGKFTFFNTLRYRLSSTTPKKKILALNNINISIKRGEMVAIIGPNGAGKTTLLRVLSGIMAATSGNYMINEKVSSIFELGLGFNPRFTALQNVYLYGALHGFSRKQIDKILPEIIEFSGLEEFMAAKLSEYSSGMRQRLAFATIIQTIEGVVLVDEVMAVGDESFRRKCVNTFKRLLREGKTILFATHGLNGELKELCKHVLYLNQGEQRYYGPADEALSSYGRDIKD